MLPSISRPSISSLSSRDKVHAADDAVEQLNATEDRMSTMSISASADDFPNSPYQQAVASARSSVTSVGRGSIGRNSFGQSTDSPRPYFRSSLSLEQPKTNLHSSRVVPELVPLPEMDLNNCSVSSLQSVREDFADESVDVEETTTVPGGGWRNIETIDKVVSALSEKQTDLSNRMTKMQDAQDQVLLLLHKLVNHQEQKVHHNQIPKHLLSGAQIER